MNRKIALLVAAAILFAVGPVLGQVNPPTEPRCAGNTVWLDGQVYWYLGHSNVDPTDAAGHTYFTGHISAGISIYTAGTNTWRSSNWNDPTSPLGWDRNGDGVCDWAPLDVDQGRWMQAEHGFAYDGKVYSCMGWGDDPSGGQMWVYDPVANGGRGSWAVETANAGWAGFRRGNVGLYLTKVYLYSGNKAKRFQSYDMSTHSWDAQYADGPQQVQYCASAVCDGMMYMIGGQQDTNYSTKIWQADLTQSPPVWYGSPAPAVFANLNIGVNGARAVAYNHMVYILGGLKADGSDSDAIQVLDPSTQTVTTLTETMPFARHMFGATVDPDTGTLYCGSGGAGADVNYPTNYYATWWSADLTASPIPFTQIADDPSTFPYSDWQTGEIIQGNVKVGGVPYPGAYVGIKKAARGGYALADADYYTTTDASGHYSTVVLRDDYKVAAWPHCNSPWGAFIEHFAMSDETAVSVTGPTIVPDINVTTGVGVELAKTTDPAAVSGSVGVPDLPYGWLNAFNTVRYGGDYCSQFTAAPAWIQRDFGSDPDQWPAVKYIVLAHGRDTYQVTYEVSTSDNGTDFTTQYTEAASPTGGMTPPDAYWDKVDMIKLPEPVTARYWRYSPTVFKNPGQLLLGAFELYGSQGLVYGQVKSSLVNSLIYNAVVQLDGFGGQAMVTGTDGRYYGGSAAPGAHSLYGDALGYKAKFDTVTMPGDGSSVAQDIILTPATETGPEPPNGGVIYNGNFELGSESSATGWRVIWNSGPNTPPDHYLGTRSTAENTTPGGAASGWIKSNNPEVPPYTEGGHCWRWGWLTPTAEKTIPVDHAAVYNIYFKAKKKAGMVDGLAIWQFVWRRADGSQTGPNMSPPRGWYLDPPTTWTQYLNAEFGTWSGVVHPMVQLLPPTDAVTLDIVLGLGDNYANQPLRNEELYFDDLVVDRVPLPTVSGKVTVSGVPWANATVGLKKSSNALADAEKYADTDAAGNYSFTVSPVDFGTYYVAGWVDTFQPVETSRLVDGDKVVNLDITKVQGKNVALAMPITAGVPSVWLPPPWGDSHVEPIPSQVATDGVRDNWNFSWVGVMTGPQGDNPISMNFDLGADKSIGGAFIDWFHDGALYWPDGGYKVQYAVDGGIGEPPIGDPAWQDFYVRVGPTKPIHADYAPDRGWVGSWEVISHEPVSARYWRIYCVNGYGWSGYGDWPNFNVEEFEIYSAEEFRGCVQGIVKEAGGVAGAGDPIYNAAVQVGGFGGPADISKPNGFYLIVCDGGTQELYGDALGYKASTEEIIVPADGSILVKDVFLTPQAETNPDVSYNGNFEIAGPGGAGTAGGWELHLDNQPGGVDARGIPYPPANADMYFGTRDPSQNGPDGGAAAGYIQMGNHRMAPDAGLGSIETHPGDVNWEGVVDILTETTMTDASQNWDPNWWSVPPNAPAYTWVRLTKMLDPGTNKAYEVQTATQTMLTVVPGSTMVTDGFAAADPYNMERWHWWYWYYGWLRPTVEKRIAVDPDSLYNFYFKAKRIAPAYNAFWSFIWLRSDGSEINRCTEPSWWWTPPTEWTQVLTGGVPDVGNKPMLRMTPPGDAAYIDIQLGFTQDSTDDYSRAGTMLFDDLVVDRIPLPPVPGIGDIKKLEDGTPVALKAKSVTLAPRLAGSRVEFFYIEEPTRASGIRVVPFAPDNLNVNDMVAVSGIMATMPPGPPFGERYIANAMFPDPVATSVIKPLGVNNRAVQEDALIVGELVTTTGRVMDPGDGSYFTINDGYYKEAVEFDTRVVVAGDPITTPVALDDVITVTGVVSLQIGMSGLERVIIYRSWSHLAPPKLPIPPFHWSVGFEPLEGYGVGNVIGQPSFGNTWVLMNSRGNATATVVTAPEPVIETQALKLSAPATIAGVRDMIELDLLDNIGNVPLKYAIWKVKVWRDPGTTEYPPGSGTMKNNVWFDNVYWYTWNDPFYNNGGQPPDPEWTQPVGWMASGHLPTISGRFVEVVMYYDFINQVVTTWYDGVLIDNQIGPIIGIGGPYNTFQDVLYGIEHTNPPDGVYGQPVYIDEIDVGYDLQ